MNYSKNILKKLDIKNFTIKKEEFAEGFLNQMLENL